MKIWMQDENEIVKEGSLAAENEGLMREAALVCLQEEGLVLPDTDDIAVSVSFVTQEEIRKLNSHFRGIDRVTDVLSFPMMDGIDEIHEAVKTLKSQDFGQGLDGEIPLGDVVICTDMIRKQAEEYGHSQTRELIYLFVHSMLHLLGYDHMDEGDRSNMRAREDQIMEKLGIDR